MVVKCGLIRNQPRNRLQRTRSSVDTCLLRQLPLASSGLTVISRTSSLYSFDNHSRSTSLHRNFYRVPKKTRARLPAPRTSREFAGILKDIGRMAAFSWRSQDLTKLSRKPRDGHSPGLLTVGSRLFRLIPNGRRCLRHFDPTSSSATESSAPETLLDFFDSPRDDLNSPVGALKIRSDLSNPAIDGGTIALGFCKTAE